MPRNLNSEGFNKPVVEVYSGSGKLLKDAKGISIGKEVNKFEYIYDEEGDDTCNIVFKFDNHSNIDHPSLRQDVIIYVRWGYPNTTRGMSPKRLVVIRDTITNYDQNGIRHELICTDQVAYLKTIQHNVNEQKGFIEWLGGLSEKLTNVQIRLYNPRLKPQPFIWRADDIPAEGEVNILNGLITVRQDNTSVVKPIAPGGMSVYRVIQEETKLLEDGPYLLDGRDGTLNIRKRNFEGSILRTFNVVRGDEEVLSFTPKSKIRKNEMEATEYGSMNAEDATGTVGIEVDLDSPTYQDVEVLEHPSAGYDSRAGIDIGQELNNMMKLGFQNGNTVEDAAKIAASSTYDQHINNRGSAYVSPNGNVVSARDNLFLDVSLYGVSRSLHWNTQEQLQLATRKLENLIRSKHHNKYQAELAVVGIPSIIVNRSIYVQGKIGNIHKGKYYIKKVTHRIDMSGYTTSMNLIKTPRNLPVIKQINTLPIEEFIEGGSSSGNSYDMKDRFNFDGDGQPIDPDDYEYDR